LKITQQLKSISNKISEKLLLWKLKGKTLDQNAVIAMRFISTVGVPEMRNRIITSIENEVQECIKKGMTDEEILQPCLGSPNYLKLLEKLNLNIYHVKAIIKKQRRAKAKVK